MGYLKSGSQVPWALTDPVIMESSIIRITNCYRFL